VRIEGLEREELIGKIFIRDCMLESPKIFNCPNYRFVFEEQTEDPFSYVNQYATGKLFADHEISFNRRY